MKARVKDEVLKSLSSAVVLLLIALTANAQRLTTTYDRFEDRTTVNTPDQTVQSSNRPGELLTITAFFTCPGRAGNVIDQFGLYLILTGRQTSDITNTRLNILLDGKRTVLARATDREARFEDKITAEFLAFAIPLPLLKQIAHAKKIEMRLGVSEFRLGDRLSSDVAVLLKQVSRLRKPHHFQ